MRDRIGSLLRVFAVRASSLLPRRRMTPGRHRRVLAVIAEETADSDATTIIALAARRQARNAR